MHPRLGVWVRQAGFFSQLVFLALVDWGSLVAFRKEGAAWYHYAALAVLNAILLVAAYFVNRWLRRLPASGHGEG
jgi:hypothetical protein